MKKMTKALNVPFFYSFLAASRNPKVMAAFAGLDPVDERILHELALYWKDGAQINVVQAMHAVSFVSTTTAHRRLKTLRQSKMIALELDPQDNRIKHIVPTEKTIQYFDHLGQCVRDAQAQA